MIIDKNGWRHLGEKSMAANPHPTMGGIIDFVMHSEPQEWFIIFNHPEISSIHELPSKAEAFKVFEETLDDCGVRE